MRNERISTDLMDNNHNHPIPIDNMFHLKQFLSTIFISVFKDIQPSAHDISP